jgi:hypothetical protein
MAYCCTPLLYRGHSELPSLTSAPLTSRFVGRAGLEPATKGL